MDPPASTPDRDDEAIDGQDELHRTPKDPGGSADLAGGERRARATRPLGVATIVVVAVVLVLALGGALWYLLR